MLCSSEKSAAGDLRFQQAVVENFWATLDFDNACVIVCAQTRTF